MDSRRSCFIGYLLKVERDSKIDDLNEKYDEEKRQTAVEKLIWRAGIKNGKSKDRDKNNIICTNHLVEFHSKYISNQKYCCNPLNQERHGSVKKGNFLFLLDYSFSKLNYKQLSESNVLKICTFMARFIYNINYIKYIYIYIFQKHLHLCKISVLNILTKYLKDTMKKFIF